MDSNSSIASRIAGQLPLVSGNPILTAMWTFKREFHLGFRAVFSGGSHSYHRLADGDGQLA